MVHFSLPLGQALVTIPESSKKTDEEKSCFATMLMVTVIDRMRASSQVTRLAGPGVYQRQKSEPKTPPSSAHILPSLDDTHILMSNPQYAFVRH